MLSAYELSLIRSDFAVLIEGGCTIAAWSDSSGTQTWDATPDTCDCIVALPAKGNAVDHMEYTGGEPGLTIWLAVSQAVKAGDRIVDTRNSKNYKVVHVPSIHGDELLRGCVCTEVRTAGANA